MNRTMLALSIVLGLMVAPGLAQAGVVAVVDKATQRMHVSVDGVHRYTWVVSTARQGRKTPTGSWNAKWLSRHHRSSRYNNAPMPYSVFYNGNYAVHGTDQVDKLGSPASAGCVRLHREARRGGGRSLHR